MAQGPSNETRIISVRLKRAFSTMKWKCKVQGF